MNFSRKNFTSGLLLFFNLWLLFLPALSAESPEKILEQWQRAQGKGANLNGVQKLRFYFSYPVDLWLYYEYASRALGYDIGPERDPVLKSREVIDQALFFREIEGKSLNLRKIPPQAPVAESGPIRIPPQMPYRDFFVEYPPLALLPTLLARALGHDFHSFRVIFALLTGLATALSLLFSCLILRKLPGPWNWPQLLFLSLLAIPGIGLVLSGRLDIFPACLTVVALWAWLNSRIVLSALILATAVMLKIYPFILFPLLLIKEFNAKNWRRFFLALSIFFGALVLINLPLFHLSQGEYLQAFLYHARRPIEIESLYANAMMLQQVYWEIPAKVFFTYGSMNISNSSQGIYEALSKILPFLFFFEIYFFYFYRLRKAPDDPYLQNREVNLFVLLILAFLLTSKVFSAQYILWLFPLAFLCAVPRPRITALLFVILCALTQLIYPFFFLDLIAVKPLGIGLLSIRNILFLLMFFLLLVPTVFKKELFPDPDFKGVKGRE